MATISKLPNELMGAVFDLLPFCSLIVAGWVCRRWRGLSRNHPRFWADIRIDCLSPASLFWARQRLIWTSTRPFRLVVDFAERHAQVEKELLDLVCTNMATVRELHITLDSLYAISIFETLLNRAELLERFSLCLLLGPEGELFELQDLPLPSGIFGRSRDRLKSVSFRNVILTHITPIPAFANVDFVSIAFEERVRYEFPTYLYDYFPRMVGLALSAGTIVFPQDMSQASLMKGFARLGYLDLSFSGRCTVDVFRHIDTAKIPEISVSNANDDAVYANLGPLRSPFHMFIQNRRSLDCEELRVSIWSESTNHTRHFAESFDNYEPCSNNGPLTLFENEEFAQQISSLTIATSVWSLIVPFLPPYTLLRDLRLWITDPPGLPQQPLSLPLLDALLLEATGCGVQIATADIVAFLERTSENRVHLRLCALELVGGMGALRDHTRSIKLDDTNELSRFRVQCR